MRITSKGSVFSIELFFAFLVCVLILAAALRSEALMLFGSSQNSKQFFLEEKTIMLADALVKNRNAEQPLAGSAFFDSEKRTVISNLVDSSLLNSAKPAKFGNVEVFEISLQRKNQRPEIILSNPLPSGNCVSVKRFVVLQETSEKAIVGVIACEN
ncbi:MAG: hypothetical protein Q7R70_06650 [Candidatus Diapherotrites archaeon]|nr:hypothetical protein [Candidatus Diapherotrites archaeon]